MTFCKNIRPVEYRPFARKHTYVFEYSLRDMKKLAGNTDLVYSLRLVATRSAGLIKPTIQTMMHNRCFDAFRYCFCISPFHPLYVPLPDSSNYVSDGGKDG